VHPPGDTRIFLKQCRSLAKTGCDTHLVIPHQKNERVGEVTLHALSEPETRYDRILKTNLEALQTAWGLDADIYHLHDPELIFVGLALKTMGYTVIRDVHEDVAMDIETKYWLHRYLRIPIARVMRGIEILTARFFDQIVAATPAIAELFPPNKTTVVQNFPIVEELTQVDGLVPFSERPNVVAYVGDLTRIRGVCEMVNAMSGSLPADSRLRIAGTFSPPELKEEVASLSGWSSVEFLGWQSREEVSDLFGMAQAGLVTFLPAPNHLRAQPNKLFEYMSAGLPVVASNFPLWREIINEADCGLLVDPTSPIEIAEAVRWIFEHPDEAEAMGRRGQKAVKERYNWNTEFSNLKNLYQSLST
jgi:glycosyltransferase involved in cell wall biosynthesis